MSMVSSTYYGLHLVGVEPTPAGTRLTLQCGVWRLEILVTDDGGKLELERAFDGGLTGNLSFEVTDARAFLNTTAAKSTKPEADHKRRRKKK